MEKKEEAVIKTLKEEMHNEKIIQKKRKKILISVEERINQETTMALSLKEGASSSVATGFGSSQITPFALALKANNFQIGLLSSFVGLLSPLAQIFGSRLLEKKDRKKVIITNVTLQALMWLPILTLGILFWKGFFQESSPNILILLYSLYVIFGAIAGPSWFSLMGDAVPEKIRGKYFSKRNKITGTVSLIATLIAAFFLDYFQTKGIVLVAFSILFFFACIFRLIAAGLFTKHKEKKLELKEGYYFSIFKFVKNMPHNNFGRFVLFSGFFYFVVMIGSPFFTVYMLNDLGFSYTTLMLVSVSASFFSLLTLPIWGRLSDKYGNKEMLKLACSMIPLMCFLWVLSPNPVYLILVPQLVGGIGWAGFNLAASNFIYDSVTPERRGICVAYYSVFEGLGIFFGALVGGLLAQHLTITFMNTLLFVILISGTGRIIVPLIFFPKIKEVRKVKKKAGMLKYLSEFKPALHLRNIKPMSETIDLIFPHVKKLKFKKK
ncbi:MFS transporter [Patescibacteria group bacterium]|nr:MFS transporter [Patescibacteria group bacterium]